MRQKPVTRIITTRLTLLTLGALSGVTYAQATRTWDGGGTGATNMDIAANWSGDVVPTGAAPGDTAQWDGTVAGPLSLTYTALAPGTGLAAGNGIFFNVLGTQTSPLTINEASGTAGLRIQNLTVSSGAGALTFGGTTGTDFLTLGSGSLLSHLWTNNSTNAVTFSSDVGFGAGGGATHALTLTGPGSWNMNTSLIRTGTGTINLIKDGSGTLNVGGVNALGNAAFTINNGTLDNTSGAALTLTNTAQTWNGDFSFSTAGSSNLNDLGLGGGAVTLGTAAGTSRTITTNGAAVLTSTGVIANGTTANSIIKAGSGGLRFDGANTYSGGTTLNAGTLHIGNNSALGTGPLTVNGGVIVPRLAARTLSNAATFAADFTIGIPGFNNQMIFSGPVSLGGSTRVLDVANTTIEPDAIISGVISNGGLTKTGGGSMVLNAANSYAGATTVNGGTLRLEGSGAINSSSGITVDGPDARLTHTGSVAATPTVTLTLGMVDGSGSYGTVNVADSSGAIVGSGTTAANIGTLNFAGVATVNLPSAATGIGLTAGTLTTSGVNDAILLNITRTGPWTNGLNNLISYSSFPSADINDFDYNVASGPLLGARQSFGDLVMNGNTIALEVIGTSIYWTGLQNNQWTFNTIAGAKNWKQTSNNAATDFMDADDVVFNDTPGSNQTVQIDEGDVIPTTTVFNNSTVNYTMASSGGFGIAGGTLTKSGTGSVTLNVTNFYNGGTTLNAGTLNLNTASALGVGAVVINGGTINNTSGGAVAFTTNIPQTWNGDFTFTGSNDLDMGTGTATTGGSGDRTVTVGANLLAVGELKTAANQGFTKAGAGTLALTSTGAGGASSVVNGVLNVAGGTLQINRTTAPDANSTGDLTVASLAGTGTITNGANFERWLFVNVVGSNTFSGVLSNGGTGALGVNKPGTGTLTLTGNNSYSGVTTVGGGSLVLTGTNSLGGAVNINGGAGNPTYLNLQNSNALGTSVVTAVNRNSGIQLQGGITLPPTVNFVTSNDGTSGATVPYAIGNLGGDNTIQGNISLTAGGGGSVIQSDSGSLKLTGNITIAAAQTTRGIILTGSSTDANTFSGVLSDLSPTAVASITKNGAGTWTVSGANTYTGTTTVNAGTLIASGDSPAATGAVTVAPGATLGGNGDFGGALTIAAGAHHALAVAATPGAQATRSVLSLDLNAAGDILDLSAAATPAPGTYTLVSTTNGITGHSGGTLTDTVVNLSGLSGTVAVVGNDLVLTVPGGSAFGTWIAGYPSIPVGDRDPGDDPDKDGFSNQAEFALGGNPASGSDNAKVFPIVADSDADGDTNKELLLTIAVRSGTGTFTGATSKSAASDDPTYGYRVEGSLNLSAFNETVNVVPTAVPPAGITLPSGYVWKTFSLGGSNGTPGKGFLRVVVTP
ncbi:autotransporter-associated beta strand repeat-containing protein [Luteolibacter sp. GHJ8]|uniref:Autotransporter-associated beta strand repeat-containing protein n=1 Tax=Luteolibacter rhizosphaerae TaxID=2989719 RepID=A0ABT3GAI3_9BACT|nr:autotransporter-associated beta strand repeat-containing protein [Luteolibacter rhizosphaerae]MCW1916851.1 autotransporter-associated beta strand repeat-containing protein [Luteolibacter rhizosphaerae]